MLTGGGAETHRQAVRCPACRPSRHSARRNQVSSVAHVAFPEGWSVRITVAPSVREGAGRAEELDPVRSGSPGEPRRVGKRQTVRLTLGEFPEERLAASQEAHLNVLDERNVDVQLIGPRPFAQFLWARPHVQAAWARATNDTIARVTFLDLPHVTFANLRNTRLFLGDYEIGGINLYGQKLKGGTIKPLHLRGGTWVLCKLNDTLELVMLIPLQKNADNPNSDIVPLVSDGSPFVLRLQNISHDEDIEQDLSEVETDSLNFSCEPTP